MNLSKDPSHFGLSWVYRLMFEYDIPLMYIELLETNLVPLIKNGRFAK